MSVFISSYLPTNLSTYLPTYPRIHQLPTHLLTHLPSHPPPCPVLSITCREYGSTYGQEIRSYSRNAMQWPKHMTKFKFCSAYFFFDIFVSFLFFSFYYISCMEKASLRQLYKDPIRSMLCS